MAERDPGRRCEEERRSAWTRSTVPPPSRVVSASCPPRSTGWPVWTSADLICCTDQDGCRWCRSAAAPATWGAAMLVPLKLAQSPSRRGTEESTSTPGAVTSGFIRRESGVGPLDEKEAICGAALLALGRDRDRAVGAPGRGHRTGAELLEVVACSDNGHDAGGGSTVERARRRCRGSARSRPRRARG